jgi:multidrug efflux pump subunit AcrA (membrane-fusion protein)
VALTLVSTIVDQNGAARTRAVTIGRERGDEIEILSGLKSGDTVVLGSLGSDCRRNAHRKDERMTDRSPQANT